MLKKMMEFIRRPAPLPQEDMPAISSHPAVAVMPIQGTFEARQYPVLIGRVDSKGAANTIVCNSLDEVQAAVLPYMYALDLTNNIALKSQNTVLKKAMVIRLRSLINF